MGRVLAQVALVLAWGAIIMIALRPELVDRLRLWVEQQAGRMKAELDKVKSRADVTPDPPPTPVLVEDPNDELDN